MTIEKKWVEFSVSKGYETVTYTQEQFEEIVGDAFLAVRLGESGNPQIIWTEKYVCPIKFELIDEMDSPVLIYKRNPE